jgi:hypothetical protein
MSHAPPPTWRGSLKQRRERKCIAAKRHRRATRKNFRHFRGEPHVRGAFAGSTSATPTFAAASDVCMTDMPLRTAGTSRYTPDILRCVRTSATSA